jgi:glycosyltransferase involved in cell wall biosynthesis
VDRDPRIVVRALMNVLLLNHTAASSGAELALMRLAEGLRAEHRVALACPDGQLAVQAASAGIEHLSIPAFEASLRPDPLHTPVGLARLLAGGIAVRRVAKSLRADLVHANTTRAGLIGAVARGLGAPPLVVRAHEHLPPTAMGRAVRSVLARSSSAVVTVSKDTARLFNEGLDEPVATHVYNSFDRKRFDPERVEPAPVREELGIPARAALLGQVAQITPWKGQDTSIRALAQLRDGGIEAHLLLVGEIAFAGPAVRYDNHGYERGLHSLVAELGLGSAVHFLGRREDVPGLLRALDLSLLPSWYEPFANVMLESMAMGTPLLVSEVGGGPELVEDGVSGRLLPPKQPEVWATAARELLRDPGQLVEMGDAARVATEPFNDTAHTRAMLAVYARVLGQPLPAPVEPQQNEAAWQR